MYLVEILDGKKSVYRTLKKAVDDHRLNYRSVLRGIKKDGAYLKGRVLISPVDFVDGKKGKKNDNFEKAKSAVRDLIEKDPEGVKRDIQEMRKKSEESRNFSLEDAVKKNNEKLKKKK